VYKDQELATMHWQDNKGVHFLSSATNPMKRHAMVVKCTAGGVRVNVPTSPIQEMYAKYMKGVDMHDQLQALCTTQIFTEKWWYKVFFSS
jgi:hypothetical protein